MRSVPRCLALVLSLALAPVLLVPTVSPMAPAASAAGDSVYRAGSGAVVRQHLRYAVGHLPGAPETRAGYARDEFRLWTDADRDCRDTRAEVLIKESQTRTTGRCTVRTGRWASYYDKRVFTTAGSLDIDHLVPLAEAWASGARGWGFARREAYANDLADGRSLVAVSASANRSKSDGDPAEWMPHYGRCRYLRSWVAVKLRWRLSVDPVERRALSRLSARCPDTLLTVRRGRVATAYGGTAPTSGGGTGGSGTDPRYPTCAEAIAHGYGDYVRGRDPEYAWYRDGDGDGVACES